jgi:hypothetical protein
MQTPQRNPQGARPPQPTAPPEFQAERIEKLDEAGLIAVLKDAKATTFDKAKACQRLAVIGTAQAPAAIAPLLADAQLSQYARHALESIPASTADDVLRSALAAIKGVQLVGVINSIGTRKDAKAGPALSKLLYAQDVPAAEAAAAALGNISGLQSKKDLVDALGRTKASVRAAVADGCLRCAEALLAQGERDQALSLYNVLLAPDIPKPMRLAAMQGILAAETSLSRPR